MMRGRRDVVAMKFDKWQGLGNDFILVEEAVSPAQAQLLCDRRRGIGGDGVLLIEGAAGEAPRMVVLNADGSRPEMCGNGLRCVAGYVAALRGGASEVTIATDAGLRRCELARDGAGWQVTADMGRARSGGELRFPEQAGHAFALVDVGNPHAVTFEVYGEEPLVQLGPALEAHVAGGVNVEFCRLRDDGGIDVLVWERGVGRTEACGTGACAVAAAAAAQGRAGFDREVAVHLPGGVLFITVAAADSALRMRGPAKHVFSGELR